MSDLNALNLEPGEVVGGYTLVSRLGAGAMGSVWRVRDDGGTTYAMKILRDSLADESGTSNSANTAAHDPDLKPNITPRERLRREAMALKKVNHPGVCGIVDMELDDSLAFIVTELIEGRNLKEDVEVNGRYIGDDLERLARKLIDATKAVHAAGIVHRDIKPTNVMVSAAGPVLVDFGIAMGEGESHVTRTGLVMGTPGFIAPEIIDGAESDEMTDWWSVASVLAFAAIGPGIRHQADDGGAGARSIGQREPYRTAGRHDGRVPIRPKPRPVKALYAGPIAERHRCGRTGSERVARHSGRTVRRRRHCRNGCHNCRRCSWNRGDAPFWRNRRRG